MVLRCLGPCSSAADLALIALTIRAASGVTLHAQGGPSTAPAAPTCDDEGEHTRPCSADYVARHDGIYHSDKRLPGTLACLAAHARHNHVCQGDAHVRWVSNYSALLEKSESEIRRLKLSGSGGGILFFGNSHTAEVFEAFLCYRDDVTKFEATEMSLSRTPDMNTCAYPTGDTLRDAPLVERRFLQDETDGLMRNGTSYITEYSRATLANGARLYQATNGRFMYEGVDGLKRILKHLDIDLERLDGIVLGKFNYFNWAAKMVFPKGHNFTGKEHMWGEDEILQAFGQLGFRGTLTLWGMFGDVTARGLKQSNAGLQLPYRISLLGEGPSPLGRRLCATDACGASDGHQCLPGPPIIGAGNIATALTAPTAKSSNALVR